MTPLSLTFYLLLTTFALFSAQFSSLNTYKSALGTVASTQLRDVLNGFAVYTVNNWNNLISTSPSPITYTNPLTLNVTNVTDIKSPSSDELMLLGFLPSSSATSTTYAQPVLGGNYITKMSISPSGCTGNACSIDLYVYLSKPVALSNGQFDTHLISTAVNSSTMTMGYTYPSSPNTVVGFNNSWTYVLPSGTSAGMAMIHTNFGSSFFNANYPCVQSGCWKSPVSDTNSLPLLKNSPGDVRLVTSLGVAYSWTGTYWNALNTNALNSTFVGQNAGNSGSNNVYAGTMSGSNFFVSN